MDKLVKENVFYLHTHNSRLKQQNIQEIWNREDQIQEQQK